MLDIAKPRHLAWTVGVLLLLGLASLWLASHLRRSGWHRSEARPNVLLIVLDTTRADYLSAYGHPRPTSPHLDRLATEGALYEHAYATSFWTLPSHASLLTGLYPSEAGATSETNQLPLGVVTLAERLREAGYRTGAVVRNAWLSEERGFGQGFDDFVEAWRGDGESPAPEHEQAAVVAAIEWLEARSATAGPFFFLLNLNIAHLPYVPPEDERNRFVTEEEAAERLDRLMEIKGGWQHFAGEMPLDDTDYRILRQLYEGEVATADALMGQLLDALEERDILDDTLVIVTADHGENIGEHGMIDHLLSMYETTVRVPLVIRFPNRFAPATTVGDLVSLVDVVPTVLDVCGLLDPHEQIARHSLANPRREVRHAVFAENGRPINGIERLRRWFPRFDATTIDHRLRMIRTERYKLIWRVDQGASLFDLEEDGAEAIDLAGTERDRRNDLLAKLRQWAAPLDLASTPGRFQSRDAESLRQLRALGYLE